MADEEKPVEETNDVPEEDARPLGLHDVTNADVLYYLDRHPFLQLLNLEPTFEDSDEVKMIEAPCGWVIHDFGDALSVSQGPEFYKDIPSRTLFADEDDEEGEVEFVPGHGTPKKQGRDVARQMIGLIEERWKGVHVVSGVYFMRFNAWRIAQEKGMEVYGFEATKEDEQRAERLKRARLQRETTRKPSSR